MYKLELKCHFDASHKLRLDYDSPCQRNHGHRWDVIISIIAEELDKNGMIIDFKKLKEIVNKLDHNYLNDLFTFNPTAENISRYLYEEIIKLGNFEQVEVKVFESPDASIEYYE